MGVNAQTSVWTFTAGQTLTAAQMNDTARTGVPVFATTTTRDAAFGGTGEKTLAEGQMCYIEAAPKRLQVYNGTAWVDFDIESQTYTPTWTNVTVGNGTQSWNYLRAGKLVHVRGALTFGSTTSISGTPIITFPVTSASYANQTQIGSSFVLDSGTAGMYGPITWESTTTFSVSIYNNYTSVGGVGAEAIVGFSATVPMTWTTNDAITVQFTYQAA